MRRLSRSHTHDQSAKLGLALDGAATHAAQPPRSQSQAPVAVCVFGEPRPDCPYAECLNPEQCYLSGQCNDGVFVCVSGRWSR